MGFFDLGYLENSVPELKKNSFQVTSKFPAQLWEGGEVRLKKEKDQRQVPIRGKWTNGIGDHDGELGRTSLGERIIGRQHQLISGCFFIYLF